ERILGGAGVYAPRFLEAPGVFRHQSATCVSSADVRAGCFGECAPKRVAVPGHAASGGLALGARGGSRANARSVPALMRRHGAGAFARRSSWEVGTSFSLVRCSQPLVAMPSGGYSEWEVALTGQRKEVIRRPLQRPRKEGDRWRKHWRVK